MYSGTRSLLKHGKFNVLYLFPVAGSPPAPLPRVPSVSRRARLQAWPHQPVLAAEEEVETAALVVDWGEEDNSAGEDGLFCS